MSTHDMRSAARPWLLAARARGRAALDALDHLVGGLGTSVLAVATLVWLLGTALLCLVGVGLFVAPAALRSLAGVSLLLGRRAGLGRPHWQQFLAESHVEHDGGS